MSWREIQLGDAIHVKHGFAFKGQYFSDDGEHIVLTPGNFNEQGGFRLRPGKDRYYAGDIPEDYILDEGDLIVAMTEQGPGLLGSFAVIPKCDRYLHNQRLGLVQVLDNSVLDKQFLYYLFNTGSARGQINGSASGTKVRHTAPESPQSPPPPPDEWKHFHIMTNNCHNMYRLIKQSISSIWSTP